MVANSSDYSAVTTLIVLLLYPMANQLATLALRRSSTLQLAAFIRWQSLLPLSNHRLTSRDAQPPSLSVACYTSAPWFYPMADQRTLSSPIEIAKTKTITILASIIPSTKPQFLANAMPDEGIRDKIQPHCNFI